MKRLHVFAMLIMACFWALSGVVQAQEEAVTHNGLIAGFVFYDMNHNGTQDPGETSKIESVTVTLYKSTDIGTPLDMLDTHSNGVFEFSGLKSGNYIVKFEKEDYSFTNPDEDSETDDFRMINVSIKDEEQIPDIKIGVHQTHYKHSTVGNLVWNDLNKNGVQDLGEPGLQYVKVCLFRAEFGTGPKDLATNDYEHHFKFVAETRTDVNGNYGFGDLRPGIYFITVEVNKGWAVSPIFQGTSDEKDSDILPYQQHSVWVCLPEGNDGLSLDAGLFKIQDCDLLTLGDMVFNDCNHNGIMDCDEKGIAGVHIKLYSCDVFLCGDSDDLFSFSRKHCRGYKVDEVVTDLNGHYEFTDVLPGEYCIEVCLPHDYRIIHRDGCPDACTPETDITGCKPYNACTNNLGIDFAVCHDDCDLAAMGDLVWNDEYHDGIQNKNESGMSGITVTLYTDGLKVGSVTTDANGNYHFTNLLPGDYYIEVSHPLGYEATYPNVPGVSDDNDSDLLSTFFTSPIDLYDDEVNNSIDAGLYYNSKLVASIGDKVWRDDDGDGIQDPREPGIPGIKLKLYACTCPCKCPQIDGLTDNETYDCEHHSCADGKLIDSTTTDKDGIYHFYDIDPGKDGKKYCVQIVVPSCFVLSPYHRGHDYDENSDFWPKYASTHCLLLKAGVQLECIDAGLVPKAITPGMVGDFVWNDQNENGIQDCGEPGICGVTVELHPCDGSGDCDGTSAIARTTTDANGRYLFTNIPTEKTYYVKFFLPAGYEFTGQDKGNNDALDSDPCPEKGMTSNFTLYSGQATMIVDAGMVQISCEISNYIWADNNGNNVKDENDTVFPNVEVKLYSCGSESPVQSVVTDENGLFTFRNVPFGSYYIMFDIPAGYVIAQGIAGEGGVNYLKSPCFDVNQTSKGDDIRLLSGVAEKTGVPTEFNLSQNFPNPFNPSTSINFAIPVAGQYTLKVYNMLGQEVATLINGELNVGFKTVVFDASKLTSGVYIYRLTGNNVVMTKKMMLNK